MRRISYYKSRGQLYAKVPATSFREDGKVKKRNDGIYLGRVIDKTKNVFYSSERGIFTYDPVNNIFGAADETYVTNIPDDQRKRPKVCLDFGDSYFVYELIRSCGYDSVINSLPYRNKDTLNAMIQYYILQDKANDHAEIWYDGSVAQLLFPNANLTSQRISDFLKSIGKRENVEQFFEAHIKWIKEKVCDDPAILIDSTGLPNNIHFPLTAISNHNGKISREARMTTVVQRDTGYPLMFRITPGNINDISTITRSINDLSVHHIDTDFVLMDAGYFTDDNVDALYNAGIEFITRLPERNRNLYNSVLSEGQNKLIKQENLVRYNNRAVYIVRIDCKLGKQNHEGFAYLGYDVDRASDESHKAVKRLADKKLTDEQFQKILDSAGLFVIVSSLPYQSNEILPVYYIRQTIEQYFDISKGSSKLTPLRIHSEQALYGHLILSMIAATVNIRIMNTIKQYHDDRDSLFMSLGNQKCLVYRTQVNTCEPQAMANEFYKKFKIKCPLYLKRDGSTLKPRYELQKHAEYQV